MIDQSKFFIFRLLPKSGFARGVGVLVGGTAGAQVLLVLAAPILTRLYTPEDFGLLAIYTSLLTIIGVLASLRYELAIPLPKGNQEAANVTALCLILATISSLLTGLLVAIFSQPIAHKLGIPELADYLWLLPVGVLLNSVYKVFNYWNIRTKQFTTIAGTKLRQALATLVIQLTAFKLGSITLLTGQIVGLGVGISSLARPALANPEFKQITSQGINQAAIRYQRFPKFSTWAGIINTAGHQLPPILFAAFFTVGSAGFYALAHRILTLPTTLIGGAIGDVFFSHAADTSRKEKLGELYLKLQDTLIKIGLPPAITLFVAGPDIFALAFGEAWREAGVFSQWLSISIFAGFVVSPLSQILTILEKQSTSLILQIILFLFRLVGLITGLLNKNLELAIISYSLASFLGYVLYFSICSRHANIKISLGFKRFIKEALLSLFLITPIFMHYTLQFNIILSFSLTILFIFIRYAIIYKKYFLRQF